VEKKIERDTVRVAELDGWYVKKVVTPGRKGAFDRLFIKEGRHIWIEFKDPEGKPSELQWKEYGKLRDHGAEAHFCDNYADGKAILGIHT
jgi:hypothetical protein